MRLDGVTQLSAAAVPDRLAACSVGSTTRLNHMQLWPRPATPVELRCHRSDGAVMRHRLAAVELCKSGVDPMVLKLSERSRMIAELGITGACRAGDGTVKFRLRHGRLVSHCNSPGFDP